MPMERRFRPQTTKPRSGRRQPPESLTPQSIRGQMKAAVLLRYYTHGRGVIINGPSRFASWRGQFGSPAFGFVGPNSATSATRGFNPSYYRSMVWVWPRRAGEIGYVQRTERHADQLGHSPTFWAGGWVTDCQNDRQPLPPSDQQPIPSA